LADVNQLIQELANANDKKAKCSLISKLGNLRDEAAVKILIRCLNHEDDNEIKSYAADALEKIGGKKATQMLIRMLRNHSWITRMKAAETLGEIGEKKAVSALVRILRNDSEASVKEWAAISLGKIGDKKAVEQAPHLLLKIQSGEEILNNEKWKKKAFLKISIHRKLSF